MRFKAYAIVARAVEEGVRAGWLRAHKHVDDPAPHTIEQSIETAVLNALCEVLEFDSEENPQCPCPSHCPASPK